MRKLLILILCLASQFAIGQVLASKYYSYPIENPDTGVYSPQYQQVLTYATNNGIKHPSDNVKDVQDDLMRYLVSSGIYNTLRNRKFGAMYITLGDTSLTAAFAGINWIDTSKYNGTEVDTLTLMPYVGIKSDGDTAHYDIDMTFFAGDTTEFYDDFAFGGFYDKGLGSGGILFGAETEGTGSPDQKLTFEESHSTTFNREQLISFIGGGNNNKRLNYNLSDGGVPSPPYLLSAVRFRVDSLVLYINDYTNPSNSNTFNTNTVAGEPARQGEFAFLGNLLTTHATDGDTANITGKEVNNTITDTIQMAYIGANLQSYLGELDSAFRIYRSNIQNLNDTINPFSQDFFYDTTFNNTLPIIPRSPALFGMQTSAGSGRATGENTTVWEVTNSFVEGPGSFNAALDSAENDGTPSTIIFSSTVCFDTTFFKSITIGSNNNDLTVYGQTAPNGGVRFHGRQIVVRGSNVMFQHCRFSAGTDSVPGESPIYPLGAPNTQFSERDALKVVGDSVVFDHCTFNFGTDELAQTVGNDITFQYCLFTKPLAFFEILSDSTFTGHHKKAHPKGLIMFKQDSGKGQNLFVHRCLFISNVDRNPQVGGQARILIQENYVHYSKNGIALVYGQPEPDDTLNGAFPLATLTRNQVAQVTSAPYRYVTKGFDSAGAVWPDSNYIDGGYSNTNVPAGYLAASRLDSAPGSNYVPAYKLKKYLIARCGARPQDRDTVEKKAINELERGLLINPPTDMTEWRPLLNAIPKVTTSLNTPADPNEVYSSGYKAIEVWADSLSWKLIYPDSIAWPGLGSPPVTLPADFGDTAVAAYSLRYVTSTYSGPVIRVRRSSDNAELDFKPQHIGDSLTSWVGAGNDGFVATWYDQMDNSDATQATAAAQPQIVDGGSLVTENGKPAVDFDGSNDFLAGGSTEILNTGNPFGIFMVLNEDGTPTNNGMFSISSNQTRSFGAFINNTSEYQPFTLVATATGYTFKGDSSGRTTEQQLFNVLFDGVDYTNNTSYDFSVDGVDINSVDAGSVATPNTNEFRIGRGNADYTGQYWLGKWQEFIIYNTDQSSNRTAIESNINEYYSIY